MNFYLNERQKRRKRWFLKSKIYGSIFLFFILIAGVGYLVIYSSLFRVKNISFQYLGNQNSDVSQSLEFETFLIGELKKFFSGQSRITEFLGADNILIWNDKKNGEFFLSYPQVAELKIEKDYFRRQVKIIVKEREKFGIWCWRRAEISKDNTLLNIDVNLQEMATSDLTGLSSSPCGWFDKNGILFGEAPEATGNLINKVDDFSGHPLRLGEMVLKEKFFSNLLKIFEFLEQSGLKIKSLKLEKPELQEIIADPPNNSFPQIYFSLRIDPHFSLSALESLKNIGFEKIEYLDLRVENRVYYKLR